MCLQVWFQGGSFIMDRCEVAYNDDDLSDIFSWLGYTIQNAHGSDSAIFALAQPWEPGQELHIYDCCTLETLGRSSIKSNTPCKDAAALEVRRCSSIVAALSIMSGRGGVSSPCCVCWDD